LVKPTLKLCSNDSHVLPARTKKLIQLHTNTKKQIQLVYDTCTLVAIMLLQGAKLPVFLCSARTMRLGYSAATAAAAAAVGSAAANKAALLFANGSCDTDVLK